MNTALDLIPASIIVRTEPIQRRSAERISHLLDAAAGLIDEHGIDGLTTTAVAGRSSSSVGVVYRYFPNIQQLLLALAARNLDRFSERVYARLNDSNGDWLEIIDHVIDIYVDLVKTEPGFRALHFGDVIDERFLQPNATNNTLIANRFNELLVMKYGITTTPELSFDLEVLVEIAGSLLHRAFVYEREGDVRFIDKLRVLSHDLLAPHASLTPGA
ncbi:MAG: TetR family transcriptional regulator [Salinibacterium sp.]|nr:TetR family transcriptional regulator [Salinibacterium sp.]